MKKAICLLSGGLDSTVCLYVARSEGYSPVALSIEYGQKHLREISAARALTQKLKIPHHFAALSMPWKGSALLDNRIQLPTDRDEKTMSEKIPATYVPGRNSVFLSMALSCAETEKADAIFIGVNALDYSGYPDCRPEYLAAIVAAMWSGTKAGVEGRKIEIKAPLIKLTKKDIVLLGQKLGVPFERTWSCYAGGDKPCGTCDSCILRAKGFREAGIPDPSLVA
ncbi:MAG: 7-cyano-7-deazaguanine synthase QueC [Candidatus Omnitrophota bacterium]